MNTGKLFKKYTGKFCSVFNSILSEYGRIRCKKNPYLRWFYVVVLLANTGQGLKYVPMMEFSGLQNVLFLAHIIAVLIALLYRRSLIHCMTLLLNLVVFILRMYLSLSLNVQHFLIINVSPTTITFCYSFRNVLKLITAANSSSKKSQYGIKLTTSHASTWQSLRLCIRWRGRSNKIQMFSAGWEPIEMLEEQFGIKLTRCWSNQNCN